jgi:hypothetical protein
MQFDGAGHGVAIRDSEVAKALWSQSARQARKAKRAANRGRFVRRMAAPTVQDFKDATAQALRDADQVADRASRKGARRVAIGTGIGIGGGLTLGELGRQEIKRRYEPASKSEPITETPAGYYGYLLPTIREDIARIPVTRRNPISPLQQVAASNMMAEGTRKIRSINPFFRARRTRQGMQELVMGTQMVNRGAGEPL